MDQGTRRWRNLLACLVLVIVPLTSIQAAKEEAETGAEYEEPEELEVTLKPKHPTHKLVCECRCVSESAPAYNKVTLDVPESGRCGDITNDRVECEVLGETSTLTDCKKVAKRTAATLLVEDREVKAVEPR